MLSDRLPKNLNPFDPLNPHRSIPVYRFAEELMWQFDYDRNGVIDLDAVQMLVPLTNKTALIDGKKTVSEDHRIEDFNRVFTRDKLFLTADVNHDKHVTKEELVALVRTYDTSKDGLLNGNPWRRMVGNDERSAFEAEFAERQSEITYVDNRKPGDPWIKFPSLP